MKFKSFGLAAGLVLGGTSAWAAQDAPPAAPEAPVAPVTPETAVAPVADQAKAAAYEEALRAAEAQQRDALEAVQSAREQLQRRAEAAKQKAEATEQKAVQAAEKEQQLHQQELQEVQRSLERAHENLRRASREVARVHRDIEQPPSMVIAPGYSYMIRDDDSAVIGVILGTGDEHGVQVLGLSPDGPAERAGLRQGDAITSVMGKSIVTKGGDPLKTLMDALRDIKPGDELKIGVERNGEAREFTVVAEKREPFTWHSYTRLPTAPDAPDAPVVVEKIEVPRINREGLEKQMDQLRKELNQRRIVISGDRAWSFGDDSDQDWEFEFDDLSDFGDAVLSGTNVWFGMPLTRGLKLTELEGELGDYFGTDHGVLVLKAEDDNQLQLHAGDVILSVGGTDVNTPSDLVRALRDLQAGGTVELEIKRAKRNKKLSVDVPEDRIGMTRRVPPATHWEFRLAPSATIERLAPVAEAPATD